MQGAGEEVRSLQKRRNSVADQLAFLRAQKILRQLPFGFWKVKILLMNEQKIKGGYEYVYLVCP